MGKRSRTRPNTSVAKKDDAPPSGATSLDVLNTLLGVTGSTLRALIRYGAYVSFAYFGYLCVLALAGKQTQANFALSGLEWLGGSALGEIAPWAMVVIVLIWGGSERKLRQRVINRYESQLKKLEEAIDPERTGSGLSKTGTTHEEDDL